MDFVRRWSEKTGIAAGRFIGWLDVAASKFYHWRERYGKVNEHNAFALIDGPPARPLHFRDSHLKAMSAQAD